MGFEAASAIQSLSYTGMSEYGIPDGVVAEPTNDALVAFMAAVQAIANEEEGANGDETLTKIYQVTSDLCSGTPSPEQFAALPLRLFRAFTKWLVTEFTDPKD